MDKSLDEIITSRPRVRRGAGRRRGTGRAQVLGNTVTPSVRAKAVAAKMSSKPVAGPTANKIIVSNLPQDVNETQIKELFSTTIGPLDTKHGVTLNYDSNGRSKGVASVHFQRSGDGNKAYAQYNNRLIDGKRPMKIEIVVDPNTAVPLASRVTPAAVGGGGAAATATATAPARTGGGRGRRGRGGGRRKNDRPAKSAADLDQEMEDYTTSNGPAATA